MSLDTAWDACARCGTQRGVHQYCNHTFVEGGLPASPPAKQPPKATATQVGGTHYTRRGIQPMHYAMVNGYNALQFTVLKYIDRYDAKGTALQDLQKARHAIDMLIEHEENKGTK